MGPLAWPGSRIECVIAVWPLALSDDMFFAESNKEGRLDVCRVCKPIVGEIIRALSIASVCRLAESLGQRRDGRGIEALSDDIVGYPDRQSFSEQVPNLDSLMGDPPSCSSRLREEVS